MSCEYSDALLNGVINDLQDLHPLAPCALAAWIYLYKLGSAEASDSCPLLILRDYARIRYFQRYRIEPSSMADIKHILGFESYEICKSLCARFYPVFKGKTIKVCPCTIVGHRATGEAMRDFSDLLGAFEKLLPSGGESNAFLTGKE